MRGCRRRKRTRNSGGGKRGRKQRGKERKKKGNEWRWRRRWPVQGFLSEGGRWDTRAREVCRRDKPRTDPKLLPWLQLLGPASFPLRSTPRRFRWIPKEIASNSTISFILFPSRRFDRYTGCVIIRYICVKQHVYGIKPFLANDRVLVSLSIVLFNPYLLLWFWEGGKITKRSGYLSSEQRVSTPRFGLLLPKRMCDWRVAALRRDSATGVICNAKLHYVS